MTVAIIVLYINIYINITNHINHQPAIVIYHISRPPRRKKSRPGVCSFQRCAGLALDISMPSRIRRLFRSSAPGWSKKRVVLMGKPWGNHGKPIGKPIGKPMGHCLGISMDIRKPASFGAIQPTSKDTTWGSQKKHASIKNKLMWETWTHKVKTFI